MGKKALDFFSALGALTHYAYVDFQISRNTVSDSLFAGVIYY